MRVACAASPSARASTAGRVPVRARDVATRAASDIIRTGREDPIAVASRRAALFSLLACGAGPGGALCAGPAFASASPAPPAGDCPECVGVLNDLLNSCPAESEACVSSQNDDETHFAAPWAYSGARADAMRRVVEVVTDPSGRGVDPKAYRTNGKDSSRDKLRVNTSVAAYDESSGYVYLQIEFAERDETVSAEGEKTTATFDLELLLWDDDEVVNVRCAARDRPKTGVWSLSYVDGVRFSRNAARDVAESVRVALGWEILPVISGFDPRFNNSKRLWFEKALDFGGFDASVMDERRTKKGRG
jgi:uncharacterized protein (DUF1499 family)